MGCKCFRFNKYELSKEKGVLKEGICIDCGKGKHKILIGMYDQIIKEDEL